MYAAHDTRRANCRVWLVLYDGLESEIYQNHDGRFLRMFHVVGATQRLPVGAIVTGASVIGAGVVGAGVAGAGVAGSSVVGAGVVGAGVVGPGVVGAGVASTVEFRRSEQPYHEVGEGVGGLSQFRTRWRDSVAFQ